MNKRQKEILQNQLTAEEKELKKLKGIYNKALSDINDNLARLLGRQDADMQHVIYQIEYQKALKKQISGILDDMDSKRFESITQYMAECYDNGFIGAMYDIHGQGIPLIMPIDQEQVVKAMKTDSKISKGLYTRLGEDVTLLKKRIANNISRGIASNMTYSEIAMNIKGDSNISYNNAARIARTEGHRIAMTAAYDAQLKAKGKGADIVKQWDASLDRRTRDSHAKVDGEIKELDEKFSNGLMYPSDPNGAADEVINCRCALLQRAKWALDEDELVTLKERADFFGLDKTANYEDFKKKYLKVADKAEKATNEAFSFTKDEDKAIEWYVSGDGQWINQYLRGRGDFGKLSASEEWMLNNLESATDRTLPENVTKLYRSVDAKAVFGDITPIQWEQIQGGLLYNNKTDMDKVSDILDRTKGKTIVEKGFLSTSKDYDVVSDWGDFTGADMPIVLEFDVPKGTKGADLFKFDVDGDEQFEVLLAKNTAYKIKDISVKDGNIYLLAEIEKSLEKTGKSSTIKSIDIDDFQAVTYGKDINKEVENIIYTTIKEAENNGEFYINEVRVKSIPRDNVGVPVLQIEPIEHGMLALNINQDVLAGKTLEEVNAMLEKSKLSLANTLEEATKHECGHAKLIKGLNEQQIKELYDELKKINTKGISKIAYDDGAECIAEVEVLLFRGEEVSEEAMNLYNKYVKR